MSVDGDDDAAKAAELAKKMAEADLTPPPRARLTGGDGSGSRDLRVAERVVRSSTVQMPMLTRTNYNDWALLVRVQLQAQGWWEAIDPGDCSYHDEREAFGAILWAVPPEVLRALSSKTTAKEAWDAVKMMRMGSERVREARAQTHRREFENLAFKDGEKMEEFAMRLTGIVNDLEALGDGVTEHKAVLKFLRCVPKQYRQLAHSIQSLLDLKTMSIEELTGRFLAVEEELDMDEDKGGTRLLLTEEEWTERMKKNRRNNKKKLRCFNCQEFGHFAWECPEKKKDQAREKNKAQEDEEKALLAGYGTDEPALL